MRLKKLLLTFDLRVLKFSRNGGSAGVVVLICGDFKSKV